MRSERQLQCELGTLSGLLDGIVVEQAGSASLELIRKIRELAKERRADLPGAQERLRKRISGLNEQQMRVAIRALSLFFDLANLAEDLQRVRILRRREREQGLQPRQESIGDAISRLKSQGVSAEQMQQLLDSLWIEPVFTAHPTEAKRRANRRLLRRLRSALQKMETADLLPREEALILRQIESSLTILWQIDLMRPHRPTVMQEVERGLFFTEGLWEVVPRIFRDLREALRATWPEQSFRVPPFLRFGSWIGGDRDGNPYVTAETTAETLSLLRRAALTRHREHCRRLLELLVLSERQVEIKPSVKNAVEQACHRWPEVREQVETIAEVEVYRRWLKVIEFRLMASLETGEADGSAAAYGEACQLEADVRHLTDSLAEHHGEVIVDCELQEWLDLIGTFGLHLAALDVRQASSTHRDVMTELFRLQGETDEFGGLPEPAKQELLTRTLEPMASFDEGQLSAEAQESLALFRLLARTVGSHGLAPLGGYIISMTHAPSDVLIVLWLWQWAWRDRGFDQGDLPQLPIVPLLETIGDLQRGADMLDALLSHPTYSEYVKRDAHPMQMVMVGYSDSTKDGGYLAAGWKLHQAQEELARVADKHGVRLVLFHGRGGALGRGGGPAARAILSLPPRAVGGALRVTEQGEVLAERYDDPYIAHRHLEQITSATLRVTGEPPRAPDPQWVEMMNDLSRRSYEHYRRLVEASGFLDYFDQATPIAEIEHLPIGSRPARRRAERSLDNLRAIPWTFAWTQSRHIIPAWYGLGTAVQATIESKQVDWAMLQEIYREWRLFRALWDNADLALAKADIDIARGYAELARDHDAGERIWQMIDVEYRLSRAVVLLITGQTQLLGGTPWLQRSIQARNPYVDPLNLMQIELFRRVRGMSKQENDDERERARELLRLTIQGVAAGMRTTG